MKANVAENHAERKLARLIADLEADGVRLAPGLTPRLVLMAEEAGLVLDLETGRIAGTENERYALTATGYSVL